MLVIDRYKCTGCGLCVEVCTCQVLVLVGDVVEINEKREQCRCTQWCTMCELVCSTGAIQYPFEVVIEG
jgi:NAD-dependent dihydropyrimidine dehydrogenase PreA subunit